MTYSELTLLLNNAIAGDRDSSDKLFKVVYQELRSIAQALMKGETDSNTLQPTALVHELWFKLFGANKGAEWKNREHFLATAAKAMRRILIDSARARKAQKRGGGAKQFELRQDDFFLGSDDRLLALDEALTLFHEHDEKKAKLVELRFFGGCTNQEAAKLLGISVATAERYWSYARAWLRQKIEG